MSLQIRSEGGESESDLEEGEYEVERILDVNVVEGEVKYLVSFFVVSERKDNHNIYEVDRQVHKCMNKNLVERLDLVRGRCITDRLRLCNSVL